MSRMTLTGSSVVTLGAIAITSIAFATAVPPLARALLASGPAETDLEGQFARFADEHADLGASNSARFNGRSFFFAPKPPPGWQPERRTAPTPPPRVIEEDDNEPPPPPPPPPPRRYTGPKIIGIDGQSVYFDRDGIRVRVGETNDTIGVTVVSLEGAPWTVRVAQSDTEFDVPLFERSDGSAFFSGSTTLEGSPAGSSSFVRPASSSGRNRATPQRGSSSRRN